LFLILLKTPTASGYAAGTALAPSKAADPVPTYDYKSIEIGY
jgi:hypothetical protein